MFFYGMFRGLDCSPAKGAAHLHDHARNLFMGGFLAGLLLGSLGGPWVDREKQKRAQKRQEGMKRTGPIRGLGKGSFYEGAKP